MLAVDIFRCMKKCICNIAEDSLVEEIRREKKNYSSHHPAVIRFTSSPGKIADLLDKYCSGIGSVHVDNTM